jgi:hypothetical protein
MNEKIHPSCPQLYQTGRATSLQIREVNIPSSKNSSKAHMKWEIKSDIEEKSRAGHTAERCGDTGESPPERSPSTWRRTTEN